MSELSARLVITAVDRVSATLDSMSGRLTSFSRRAQRMGDGMQRVGQRMSTRLTLPIVGFGAKSLWTAAQFEQAMNRVQAVSGATETELVSLTEKARELGESTQYTAAQAADAMGFLAMAGFDANQILGAIPGTLQLAASANMDLARAADIVSNVLTGYGKDVSELSHVNDVLVKSFTSANTNLEQLGEAMKYAGPIASAARVQFEEAAAAISLMGNAGIQGSLAGTSLRGAIRALLNPSKQVREAMKDIGLQVTDATGKMRPLADLVEDLAPHAEDAGLFMKMFGQRAGPAMAALVSQGSDALRKLTSDLEQSGGTAERIASVQMRGFMGEWRKLVSAFEGLQLAIADSGLLASVSNLITKLTGFVRTLSQTNPEMLRFGVITAAIAAAAGPLLWIVGGLVKGFGTLAIGAGKLIGLLKILVTTSLGPWVAGIALVAAGVVERFDAIKAAAGDLGEGLGRLLGANTWGEFKQGFAQVDEALTRLVDETLAGMLDVLERWTGVDLRAWFEPVGRMIDGLKASVDAFMGSLRNSALGRFLGFADEVSEEGESAAKRAEASGEKVSAGFAAGIRSRISDITSAAREMANAVGDYLPQSPAKRGPLRRLPHMGQQVAEQLVGGMRRSLTGVTRTALALAEASMPPIGGAAFAGAGAGARGGMTNVTQNITFNVRSTDPHAAAEEMMRELDRYRLSAMNDIGVT